MTFAQLDAAASASSSNSVFARMLSLLWEAIEGWHRRRAERDLCALSGRTLADIGLTRSEDSQRRTRRTRCIPHRQGASSEHVS